MLYHQNGIFDAIIARGMDHGETKGNTKLTFNWIIEIQNLRQSSLTSLQLRISIYPQLKHPKQ